MKNLIKLWNINTSSKNQSKIQRKLGRFFFVVQNMDFNLPILGIPLEFRLMNGLNVFSMCLSGCHTECSIKCKGNCARGTDSTQSQTHREETSSELTCFWVGRSFEWIAILQYFKMEWIIRHDWIAMYAMCRYTRTHTHTMNEYIYGPFGISMCILLFKERLVSVTSDYVSNHSIHCNLTTEVLNWEMKSENGFSIQCVSNALANRNAFDTAMTIIQLKW